MIPFDTLVELLTIANTPWGFHSWYSVAPPTTESIKRIERELGIQLPRDYVSLAKACVPYGGWLASIGDDYEHGCHILQLNKAFHDSGDTETIPLPSHYILLNHGHDCDCDCWDTRSVSPAGEHPIVYIDSESKPIRLGERSFSSFREYIENYARLGASKHHDPKLRQRAMELLSSL